MPTPDHGPPPSMSETEQPEEQQRRELEAVGRLTDANIVQYLLERGADPKCPSCGKNDWSVFNPARDGVMPFFFQPANTLVNNGIRVGGGKTIPAMLMLCQNCGLIRPHAAMLIAQWKLAKEQDGGHDGK